MANKEVFKWNDVNTSFSDVVSAMDMASRTRQNNMSTLDAYRKDMIEKNLAQEELDRTQRSGQMLSDLAAGKEAICHNHMILCLITKMQKNSGMIIETMVLTP